MSPRNRWPFDRFAAVFGGGYALVLILLGVVLGTLPVKLGSAGGLAYAVGAVLMGALGCGVGIPLATRAGERSRRRSLAKYDWRFSPADTCDWCGRPPAAPEMLALVGYTRPGETEPRPIEVCPGCALGFRFTPWIPEPLDCEEGRDGH